MHVPTYTKKVFLPFCLLLFAVLCFYKIPDRLLQRSFLAGVINYPSEYLQASFDKSVKGFIVLSTIKSGLAIIEGSTIGIGFNLQIGDVVQPVYDYIDIAWKTALAGSTILLLTKIILYVITSLNHIVFAFALFSLGVFSVVTQWLPAAQKTKKVIGEIVRFIVLIALVLSIVFPCAITVSSFLSQKITAPLIAESMNGFSAMQNDFSSESISEQLFDSDSTRSMMDLLNIPKQYARTGEKLKTISASFKKKMESMAILTIKMVAGYVFDCIIFPFAFFFVFYNSMQWLILYSLNRQRNNNPAVC